MSGWTVILAKLPLASRTETVYMYQYFVHISFNVHFEVTEDEEYSGAAVWCCVECCGVVCVVAWRGD